MIAENIGALLDRAATDNPAGTALIVDDRRINYAELHAKAVDAARGLAAIGVTKGTHVGVLLPNSPAWLALAFGTLKLGAVLVPLNTLMREPELAHALTHAEVAILVTAARFLRHEYVEVLLRLCPALRVPTDGDISVPAIPALRRVVVMAQNDVPPGALSMAALRDASAKVPANVVENAARGVTPADTGAIFFTSGSTALPKGAMHTHGAMIASAGNIAEVLGLTARDVIWGYLPFFFAGGFIAIELSALITGGSVALQEVFEPGATLRLLERTGCTTVFGWPHQMQALIKHPTFARTRLCVRKGVGANTSWAEGIYPPEHQAVSTYGMTESGPMSVATRWNDPPHIRSSCHGRPLSGVALVIADAQTARPLPAGEEGEILLRGATMMTGYYGLPRSASFDESGFFHTGDSGWLDADGFLHFTGRLKDVIKTVGVNVACSEIEAVLRAHPDVREAHVVGVPHLTRGENPVAFVVSDRDPGTDALIAFCRERLASYKVPRHVFFLRENELPVLGSGKVLKERLRQEAIRLVESA